MQIAIQRVKTMHSDKYHGLQQTAKPAYLLNLMRYTCNMATAIRVQNLTRNSNSVKLGSNNIREAAQQLR